MSTEFLREWWKKNDNSKNNVPAFKEHLSLTLFSQLYPLNMKILNTLLVD